jgi:uncharacterized membrane protein
MDAAHLHLLLNHIPILGVLFAICIGIYGLLRKNDSLEKAGLVTLIIVSLVTIPAFLTGEGAEEAVEHLPGVSESLIEKHEELAETSLWLMLATGVLALIALILIIKKSKQKSLLSYLSYALAIGTFVLMTQVGNDGGKIRHSELRGDSVETSDQSTHDDTDNHDDDDDDDDD